MKEAIRVRTAELPESLREALRALGYRRQDVGVEVTSEVSPHAPAGEGRRGFSCVVELATGRREAHYGDWGGGGPTARQVDADTRPSPLLDGFAIVKGSEGYPTVLATVYLSPSNVAKVLPPVPAVTPREAAILGQFRSLTSAGRKDEWERNRASRPTPEELDSLVARGLLSRNKAGATSITTEGKNAAA